MVVTVPITIKWWHALEDQYSATVDKVVSDFNNSQDLITVEAEYIGSYSKLNEALVAAVVPSAAFLVPFSMNASISSQVVGIVIPISSAI